MYRNIAAMIYFLAFPLQNDRQNREEKVIGAVN